MNKIKVFHLITELERGGAEILLLDLLPQLSRDKFEISLGYLRGTGTLAENFKKSGIRVTAFNISSRFDLAGVFQLAAFLRRNDFAIVHTHLIDADIYGFFAARLAKVPITISTKHNPDDFRRDKSLAVLADSFVANNSTQIIAVSQAVRNFLIKQQNINLEKITVIHNGINMDRFIQKKSKTQTKIDLGLAPDKPVVGTIARFNEQKGHKYLVTAIPKVLASVPDVQFAFAGTGCLENSLKDLAKKLKVDKAITFLGLRSDITDVLAAFDIFVLPSLWEGFGIALLEAQAAGVPVIASQVDGIIEVVQDKKTGILVPPANPEELARAIIELCRDRNKAKNYSDTGFKYVNQNFNIRTMAQKIESLYITLSTNQLS